MVASLQSLDVGLVLFRAHRRRHRFFGLPDHAEEVIEGEYEVAIDGVAQIARAGLAAIPGLDLLPVPALR
jgi:hypothetical protein